MLGQHSWSWFYYLDTRIDDASVFDMSFDWIFRLFALHMFTYPSWSWFGASIVQYCSIDMLQGHHAGHA
jgi:hypothetical protein